MGVVINKLEFFDTLIHQYVHVQTNWPDSKIWFQDSAIIQQMMALETGEGDSTGHVPIVRAVPYFYVYVNGKNGKRTVYYNFSDTAKALPEGSFGENKKNGSPFWDYDDIAVTTPSENMPDTVLNNISYRRIRYINTAMAAPNVNIFTGYARCDKKGTYFPIDRTNSEKIGCPIIILETATFSGSERLLGKMKHEIEFISDTLSLQEKNVFAAWERNAKAIKNE